MRRIWRAWSSRVSTIWLFNAAVTMFLMVVAGSVTTVCAWTTPAPSPARSVKRMSTRRMMSPPLRLAPRAPVIRGPADQTRHGGAAVQQAAQLHVHDGGLGVPQPFAAGEQLFERVRQELIRRHVLASGEQLA